jgi:hypothetical protein
MVVKWSLTQRKEALALNVVGLPGWESVFWVSNSHLSQIFLPCVAFLITTMAVFAWELDDHDSM